MKLNKIVTLITSAVVAVSCLSGTVSVSAETYSEYYNYENLACYNVDEDDDGTFDYVVIVGGNASATEIEIPSEIEGVPVKYIRWNSFEANNDLESIAISEGIISIGSDAFTCCKNLKSVTLPDSLVTISYAAFTGCTSLESITIPEGVTTIQHGAFSGCTNLENINIPDGVTEIDSYVFYDTAIINNQTGIKYVDEWVVGCDDGLTDVRIKEGTRGIADRAFYECEDLESLVVPESVEYIGDMAFHLCKNLESVTILNPECEIYDWASTISNGHDEEYNYYFNGTIYGYENSTSQAYAEKYDYNFVLLGDAPTEDPTEPVTTVPVVDEPTANTDPEAVANAKWGDVNVDGAVDVSDIVTINMYILNAATSSVTTQGLVNANCNYDNAIDSTDSTLIMNYVSMTIEYSKLGKQA